MSPIPVRFATRLNSFAAKPQALWPSLAGKPKPLDLTRRAATVKALTDVDLNYPDHVSSDPAELGRQILYLGPEVNGLAMRYCANPAFKLGAFTHPDRAVRPEAIDLTNRGIDAARAAGLR